MILWIINVSIFSLIILIVYWFWISKPHIISAKKSYIIDIFVKDGVYQPSQITAVRGQPLTLRFKRIDPSPCAESVIFNQLKISQTLPLNTFVTISIPTDKDGKFEFTCQMGMYRGKVIIKN